MFSNKDYADKDNLQKVGDELRNHGSKEKTGFMEKEADFVKNLKAV